jgi:hypothetical protein
MRTSHDSASNKNPQRYDDGGVRVAATALHR